MCLPARAQWIASLVLLLRVELCSGRFSQQEIECIYRVVAQNVSQLYTAIIPHANLSPINTSLLAGSRHSLPSLAGDAREKRGSTCSWDRISFSSKCCAGELLCVEHNTFSPSPLSLSTDCPHQYLITVFCVLNSSIIENTNTRLHLH